MLGNRGGEEKEEIFAFASSRWAKWKETSQKFMQK
jgi:hypothetical protein